LAEEKFNLPISVDSIKNILTLRYDPLQEPNLPSLNWNQIKPIENASTDFIKRTIENSINQNLDSEPKKISIALSGGIDSTLVLGLLKKTLPNTEINAISIKFSDSIDETQQAKKIAEHFDVDHQILELENYLENLPKAISITGLPFWDNHWYYVVEKASKTSKHLISGDGGDELFGGYTFRYSKFSSLISHNSSPLDKVKAYLQCHERDSVPDQSKLFGNKIKFDWNSIYSNILPYFQNNLNELDQLFLADYNGKLLYNFSIINPKFHNHFNIKSITPLLSNELIYYSTKIKHDQKYDSIKNIGKQPFRKILSELNISHLVSNTKQGFSVNTINLWKTFGYEICKSLLLDGRTISDGFVNYEWVKKYIDQKDLDVKYINKFFGLLAFEVWYRIFVTKEMNSNSSL
jgi:asparagine synthase (glutamine-hydrolysing)